MNILIKPLISTLLSFFGLLKTTESLSNHLSVFTVILFLICAIVFAFGLLDISKRIKTLTKNIYKKHKEIN